MRALDTVHAFCTHIGMYVCMHVCVCVCVYASVGIYDACCMYVRACV